MFCLANTDLLARYRFMAKAPYITKGLNNNTNVRFQRFYYTQSKAFTSQISSNIYASLTN